MKRSAALLVAVTMLGITLVAAPAHAAATVKAKNPDQCFYEGLAPEKKFGFKVVLSEAADKTVKVDYETLEDVARFDEDFVKKEGTLTFLEGDKAKTVRVPVVDDKRNERSFERLVVKLSNARGASIADATAAGWICNDDPNPMLDVNDVSVSEAVEEAEIPISLTERSGRKVTLDFVAGHDDQPDYTDVSGTLVWPPGSKTRKLKVPITFDQIDETSAVAFTVDLGGGTNIGTPTHNTWQFDVKILDDDPPPTVSVDDVEILESDAITGSPIPIPLTWIGETEKNSVFVYFRLVPFDDVPSEGDADPNSDYTPQSGAALMMNMSASVTVHHDTDNEPNETFRIELYDPTGLLLGDSDATVTIMDDDVPGG
jgi:hypothetical protein